MARRSRRRGNLFSWALIAGVGVVVFVFHDKIRLLISRIKGMFTKTSIES